MNAFKLILTAVTLVVATPTFAQDHGGPLHDKMEQIGKLFKAINLAAKDPAQNPQSTSNAAKLEVLFTACLNLIPDALADLPSAQQAAAKAGYEKLMNEEIRLSQELQKAFLANDNASALKILATMNQLKRDGHSQFDPN